MSIFIHIGKYDLKQKGKHKEKPKRKQGSPRIAQEPPKRYTRYTKNIKESAREPNGPQKNARKLQRHVKRAPKRCAKPAKGTQKAAPRNPRDQLWAPWEPACKNTQNNNVFKVTFGTLSGSGGHAIRKRLCRPNT